MSGVKRTPVELPNMHILERALGLVVLALSCSCASSVEYGTWSIAAVDRETGQVGIAGASCTSNVQGIGTIVPGVGAVIVQAMSNKEARAFGLERLRAGETPEAIVEAMKDARFDPQDQQYAVVVLDAEQQPANFTGAATDGWHGAAAANGVTVQGNCLVSEEVVQRTLATFQSTKGCLTEKLVRALAAGADAGGDKRCGEQRATSAFVTVYDSVPDTPDALPYFNIQIFGVEKGGAPAVALLVKHFDALFPLCKDMRTTRLSIDPDQPSSSK
jgi:uncharacterized Ntn-hydrolase superfamily protein